MNFNKTPTRRALSILLAFALVLPAFLTLVGKSGSAEAAVSLPNIEKLKQAGGTFKILEIVPNAEAGALGYYIPNQEPSTHQMANAGALNKDERKKEANTLLKNLKTSELLGKTEQYPLKLTMESGKEAGYKEYFPWDVTKDKDTIRLSLNHKEENKVKGIVEKSGGALRDDRKYEIAKNGDYVQIATGLVKENSAIKGAYYYNVKFEKVPDNEAPKKNALIYAVTQETSDITATINGEEIKLKCIGVVGSEEFIGLEEGVTHYEAQLGQPFDSYSGEHPYRAIGTEFRKVAAKTGFFSPDKAGFTYVGTGGTHDIDASAAISIEDKISYNYIYFTPGYTNNEWFMKYVFDWEHDKGEARPKLSFSVETVVGNLVTKEMVNSANLIVLSNGFDLSGNNPYVYAYNSDIKEDIMGLIFAAARVDENGNQIFGERGVPIIVDGNLKFDDPAGPYFIEETAQTLVKDNKSPNFVDNNIFCSTQPLAIKVFKEPYQGDTTIPFAQVLEEIKRENAIRAISGIEPLPAEVTMARAIRAIISYSGRDAAK
ncbi:MAG: hypothetical protein RR394_09510, partial [Oscillospiraceae bacterium]